MYKINVTYYFLIFNFCFFHCFNFIIEDSILCGGLKSISNVVIELNRKMYHSKQRRRDKVLLDEVAEEQTGEGHQHDDEVKHIPRLEEIMLPVSDNIIKPF